MGEFIVRGNPASPFVRSACLGLEEKGAPYRVEAMGVGEIRGEAHRRRHPFGRIPVLDHGAYRLYETQAILRYIDAQLPNPALQPTDPRAIGRMNQIIGINDWYLFPLVLGTPADEAAIAAAVPAARLCLGELNRLLGDQSFLTGEQLSLADLLLAPQIYFIAATPEGGAILKDTPLLAWLRRMNARPSMQATLPPEALRQAA